MNPPPGNHVAHRAFTLIELLTVITIILILAGLAIPVYATVMERARRTQAAADAKQIAAALATYHNDYAKFPVADYVTSDPPTDIRLGAKTAPNVVDNNADLFNILRAISAGRNADNAYNPKQIPFFEGRPVSNPNLPKSGFLDAAGTGVPGAFYDPWGNQYIIVLDANYNNVINLQGFYSDFTQQSQDNVDTGVRMTVGVISLGKDGQVGSPRDGVTGMYRNGNKVSDDIVSWQ
jgi:prepilin-type N-terminal cleavage/methylation domain-containing protein